MAYRDLTRVQLREMLLLTEQQLAAKSDRIKALEGALREIRCEDDLREIVALCDAALLPQAK